MEHTEVMQPRKKGFVWFLEASRRVFFNSIWAIFLLFVILGMGSCAFFSGSSGKGDSSVKVEAFERELISVLYGEDAVDYQPAEDNPIMFIRVSGQVWDMARRNGEEETTGLIEFDRATSVGAVPGLTSLERVKKALNAAATDSTIKGVLIDVSHSHSYESLTQMLDLSNAIRRFREQTDKPVVAWAEGFSTAEYVVASAADHVLAAPYDAAVLLHGFSAYPFYMKSMIDKFGVKFVKFATGEEKAFGDTLTRDSMSQAQRDNHGLLLRNLWTGTAQLIDTNRGWDIGTAQIRSDNWDQEVVASGGNELAYAKDYGFIDDFKDFQGALEVIVEMAGADVEGVPSIGNSLRDYRQVASTTDACEACDHDRARIAVIEIVGALQPESSTTDDSVATEENVIRRLKEAASHEHTKAIVLKVTSPGGAVTTSEAIAMAIDEIKATTDIPVVGYMRGVAASGGYYVVSGADVLVADYGTVTGSIGVVTLFPQAEGLLEKTGLSVDGIASTRSSEILNNFLFDEDVRQPLYDVIKAQVSHDYDHFLSRVANGRDMAMADVKALATGAVFSEAHGKNLGLVDEVGGLDDAIRIAAELADIGSDYAVWHVWQWEENALNDLFELFSGPFGLMDIDATEALRLLLEAQGSAIGNRAFAAQLMSMEPILADARRAADSGHLPKAQAVCLACTPMLDTVLNSD